MEKRDKNVQEAEKFVRKALSHFSDANANEAAIKSAALKVSKSLPQKSSKAKETEVA